MLFCFYDPLLVLFPSFSAKVAAIGSHCELNKGVLQVCCIGLLFPVGGYLTGVFGNFFSDDYITS